MTEDDNQPTTEQTTKREWRWIRRGSCLFAQLWILDRCLSCAGNGEWLPRGANRIPSRKLDIFLITGRMRMVVCGKCDGIGKTWRPA